MKLVGRWESMLCSGAGEEECAGDEGCAEEEGYAREEVLIVPNLCVKYAGTFAGATRAGSNWSASKKYDSAL